MRAVFDRFDALPVRILGLMSGTSLDGLDIALVRWNTDEIADFSVEATDTMSYPNDFRQRVLKGMTGSAEEICALNFEFGRRWTEFIRSFLGTHQLSPEMITCIGSHGQTLWHISGDSTLQIGEPAVISASLGIPVVSNFREHDIAVGGTGAPLIAFLDWLAYRNLPGHTVALNIGGIANVTCISEGCAQEEVIGWDTGPGNMVVDTLIRQLTGGADRYDSGGAVALTGIVDPRLLAELMDDPFVQAPPPKSTGREYYSEAFVREHLHPERAQSPATQSDLIATASEWTVRAIAENIDTHWKPAEDIDRVIVGGGGVHNRYFMQRLASHFGNADISRCAEYGIPVDAKEAVGFAVLAYVSVQGIPANMPGVTGANRRTILGKLTV